jgi:protein arginine N-methyltransferase 1
MLMYYKNLLTDKNRIMAFKQAIATLVNSNTKVAEIGSALGTYSFFAAMQNAQKVYAIEKDDVFYLGEEIARRNQWDKKITFYHDRSQNVQLPEKVDFIILEDYNPMFASEDIYKTITDARRRLLKKGGKFIPNRFTLKFALVEYPDFYNILNTWQENDYIAYELNWEPIIDLIFNQPHQATASGIKLLSDEVTLTEFDLTTVNDITFNYSDKITCSTAGIIHGLIGWWDCWFTPEQFFSNTPREPENSWGQMYFPIRYPIEVSAGDSLQIDFSSSQSKISSEINYQWSMANNKTSQSYNTFAGQIINREIINKSNPGYVPTLNKDGKIAQLILNQVNGKSSISDIAEKIHVNDPEYSTNREQLILKIGKILKDYI